VQAKPAGIVIACTVGNAVSVTPMVYTVFGLFLIPIATEFDWPRATVSLALLLVAVAGAVSYPLVGRAIDRFGARPVVLIGNLSFAAAVGSVAFVEASRVQFYLAYTCIGVTAAIPSSAMLTKVIAGWFDRNRGLFLGVAGGLGNGVGAALSPLLVHVLIAACGWRTGYLGAAAAIVLVGFPVLYLLLHDPPRTPPPGDIAAAALEGMSLREARATTTFWMILIAVALGAGCMTAVFAHVVPMLLDRGLPAAQATTVLAVFSMVTAFWQIGVGFMLDRYPRPWIAAPFYLSALAGLLVLEAASSYGLLVLAGALMGLGLGTEFGILPYFLSRYFGVRHYGAIAGVIYGVILLIQGIAPFLMDLVFDATGTYDLAVAGIGAGLVLGALVILRLPPFALPPSRP
jgi:MFS family permease